MAFKRTVNDSARRRVLTLRAHVAQQLKKKPHVFTHHVATGGRSEVRHIVAGRDNAKRGRKAFSVRDDEINEILRGTDSLRRLIFSSPMSGNARIKAYLTAIGAEMIKIYHRHIDTGLGFAPLTPGYAKRAKPGKILLRSGALRGSVRAGVKV